MLEAVTDLEAILSKLHHARGEGHDVLHINSRAVHSHAALAGFEHSGCDILVHADFGETRNFLFRKGLQQQETTSMINHGDLTDRV